MPTNAEHSASYLKFIHLSQALRGLPGLPTLDPIEERLLTIWRRLGSPARTRRC